MEDRTADFVGAALGAAGWQPGDTAPPSLPPLTARLPRLTPAHPAPLLLLTFYSAAATLVRLVLAGWLHA